MQTISREFDDRIDVHLLSDLHVGHAATRYDKIAADVDAVRRDPDAVAAIAGDVFDAITPDDVKRYRVDSLHPRVRCDDTIGRAVEWAYELLAPIAGKLAFISPGNHDEKAKRHGIDPVAMLCDRLDVPRAEYAGVLSLRVGKRRFNVGWWHGHGGGSTHQSAVKQSSRLLNVVEGLDACWTGHRHQRFALPTVRYEATKRGLEERRVWLLMSGAYLRDASYAIEQLHPPGDLGGVVLRLHPDGRSEVRL